MTRAPGARVFVTGASGFVGHAVVRTLLARGHTVSALMHTSQTPPGVENVSGELLAPETYQQAVAGADAVIHLAAATGKMNAAAAARINVEGTRVLAAECAAGRRPLLFVSSVAVQYPSHSRYPYAETKAAAEVAVRASGTPYMIARPTIIAGPGSPVISGLARLASLPVVPVFGDGQTRVQPVDVEDVALVLADIVEGGQFESGTLGIGGQEVVTIESLLMEIRAATGRRATSVVHLPLRLVLPCLSVAERLLRGRVPLTVGQLSVFRYDGTVACHPMTARRKAGMHTLADMLRRTLNP